MTSILGENQKSIYVGTISGDAQDLDGTALLVIDMQYGAIHADHGWKRMYRQMGLGHLSSYSLKRVSETVTPNISALLDAFRSRGLPVIYTTVSSERNDYSDLTERARRHMDEWTSQGFDHPYSRLGEIGSQVIAELAPLPGEVVINKTRFSAFNGSDIDRVLKEHGVRQLAVTGVGTNYCVQCTLLDAYDHGYDCILVEDGTGTLAQELQDVAVKSMEPYARIANTASLLESLGRRES